MIIMRGNLNKHGSSAVGWWAMFIQILISVFRKGFECQRAPELICMVHKINIYAYRKQSTPRPLNKKNDRNAFGVMATYEWRILVVTSLEKLAARCLASKLPKHGLFHVFHHVFINWYSVILDDLCWFGR